MTRPIAPVEETEMEYRYQLSSMEAREFIHTASKHLVHDVYDIERPVAYTRTTYFDTADGQLSRKCDGRVDRRVRLRQYASAPSTMAEPTIGPLAYLEFKESVESRRLKVRHGASPSELRRLLASPPARSSEDENLFEGQPALYFIAHSIRQGELFPIFSTWYRRMSLSCESVRLTIDENVTYCEPFAMLGPDSPARPARALDLLPGRIVELKIRGEAPDWLSLAMEQLRGTETPSKFHRGLAARRLTSRKAMAGTRPLAVLAPIHAKAAHD